MSHAGGGVVGKDFLGLDKKASKHLGSQNLRRVDTCEDFMLY